MMTFLEVILSNIKAGDLFMLIAPEHIQQYCSCSTNLKLLSEFQDDKYSFVYQIRCTCGCKHFKIYINDTPKVIAYCQNCKNKIIIYDLTLYPTSAPSGDWIPGWLAEEGELQLLQCLNDSELFVNYQYGYCVSDKEFNANDVTGFNMWIYENKDMLLIIDDETA